MMLFRYFVLQDTRLEVIETLFDVHVVVVIIHRKMRNAIYPVEKNSNSE